MKRLVLILLLFVAEVAFAGAPNPGDYNVTVHVLSSRTLIVPGSTLNRFQVLSVQIDGKKYELQSKSPDGNRGVLLPGNYQAKLFDDKESKYDIRRAYEFLFPDGKTRKFILTEISE